MFRYVPILAIALLSVTPTPALADNSPANPRNTTLVSGNIDETLELSFFLDPMRPGARCRASLVIEANNVAERSRDELIIEEIILEDGEFTTLDISMITGAVLVKARRVRVEGHCQLLPASRLKNSITGETQATVVVFSVRGITDESQE